MLCMACGCAEKVTVTGDAAEQETVSAETSATETVDADTDRISVFVCGAVAQEGVYELAADARKQDALEAAGGFAEGADTSSVNLAEGLVDGEKIYFPLEGESVSTGGGGSGEGALVNINIAGVSELTSLPGIGETRAERIVEYRSSHGAFASREELKNVSGIGDSTYEGLEDYITVD